MRARFGLFILLTTLIIGVSFGCLKSKKPGFPPKIIEVLNKSDIYKPGYMRCLLNFQSPSDSLKLASLYYILSNLEINYSITHTLVDSLENEIIINIEDFDDLKSIVDYRDSISMTLGKLHYKTDSIWLDFKNLPSEFILNHVNSYDLSNEVDRVANYSFETYCNYILPYRVANEPVENYIDFFREKYSSFANDTLSIASIATAINDDINNRITYDERLEFNPNYRDINEIELSGRSNLRDLCIYKIKALRSMGIAAAMDYTPVIANTNLGYYSTTVILPNNEKLHLPNPELSSLPYASSAIAKIYRRTFFEIPESLFTIKEKSLHTPSYIGNYNYLDVTNDYIQTKDTTIQVADSIDIIYLAIPNDKELVAVDWSFADSTGLATFHELGTKLKYTPVVVSNKEIVVVGDPIYLN